MDAETVDWWRTEAGRSALDRAAEIHLEHPDPVQAATALRRALPDLPADRAAATSSQAALRERAHAKFGDRAALMYFTPDALEQATRPQVAAHRAARLAIAEVGSVLDLGCGLGSDLVAFAGAGLTAAGIDRDPVRVALARANLAALGLPGAVEVAEAADVELSGFGAVFCDPARRTARGRTTGTTGWSPSFDHLVELLGGGHGARACVAKVAPGIGHDLIPDGVEAEWVSYTGQLVEASLWSPGLATVDRRATVIAREGLITLTTDDLPEDGVPVAEVGEFLYEPDDAVIRAGLVGAVAAGVEGRLLSAHIAYVSSDQAFASPLAKGYRVLDELPYREKKLRAALRERDIGTLTIKKRGVDIEPETLRARLGLDGSTAGTLVLTRAGDKGIALLVEPLRAA